MNFIRPKLLAVLALSTLLAGCNEPRDPGFQGWVEADMIFVSPDESGRVINLKVREGDEVRKGEQLYNVDDEQFLRSIGNLLPPAILHGNKITPLTNGDEIFPAMLADSANSARRRRSKS